MQEEDKEEDNEGIPILEKRKEEEGTRVSPTKGPVADWVAKVTQEEYRARVVATATKQVEWKRAAAAKARAAAKAAAMAKARAQQEDEQAAFEADVREAVARLNKQNQRSRVTALLEERDVPDNQNIRSGDSDASYQQRAFLKRMEKNLLHYSGDEEPGRRATGTSTGSKDPTGTQGARHLNCYLRGRAKAWWRRAFNAGQRAAVHGRPVVPSAHDFLELFLLSSIFRFGLGWRARGAGRHVCTTVSVRAARKDISEPT
ncbi:hypothetical protein BDZ88DRAFT_440212 [Geranomyces variabilis]|nr:hypothetical protein BDZ88DRAFT_440212 [Geranomyces variabilis]KAJ3132019.1 hypothetical protein HDU90_007570 [Geranomyces variabilis]